MYLELIGMYQHVVGRIMASKDVCSGLNVCDPKVCILKPDHQCDEIRRWGGALGRG
jgi:hypothetical protein